MNFASATNPGGGVTREVRRRKNAFADRPLYPCLDTETMWHQFYQPHRKAGDPLYNDDLLYTPEVVVFKTDIAHWNEWKKKTGIR
ncbi:MAG: poly(ADP-ribose) glycohydrolase domain-containing protein [Streptococcus sp.]